MVNIPDSEKAEIPKFSELITAPFNDKDYLSRFAPVAEPSTCFNVDSDGVLVIVSFPSARYRSLYLPLCRPDFFNFATVSLQRGTKASVGCTIQ